MQVLPAQMEEGDKSSSPANIRIVTPCLQDYGDLLRSHRENEADITIATHSVGWKQASLRGIIKVDAATGAPPERARCTC